MKKPVTIKDLANVLGIPISTVGNVLRDDPRYSDELRSQVHRMAKKMGYRRNVLASGLRGGKINTVGILWSFGGFDTGNVISHLASECYARGYSTLLCESLSEISLIEERLQDFLVRQVDAIVFQWGYTFDIPPQLIELLLRFESLVVVSVIPIGFTCHNIVLSVDAALNEIANQLIAAGCRKPAALLGKKGNEHKSNAFFKPFIESGLLQKPLPIFDVGSYGVGECNRQYKTLEKHFRNQGFMHDCLFCGVDEAAISAIRWLSDRGLRVPGDVSVVGFNDSEFCRMTDPRITSIRRPDHKLIEEVVRLLFEVDAGPACEIKLDYQLISRDSTRTNQL